MKYVMVGGPDNPVGRDGNLSISNGYPPRPVHMETGFIQKKKSNSNVRINLGYSYICK